MEPGSPTTLILYGRDGCHLCEEARVHLDAIMARRATAGLAVATIREVDITTEESLHRAFVTTIPVVEVGDRRYELATNPARLERFVADALGPGTATLPEAAR